MTQKYLQIPNNIFVEDRSEIQENVDLADVIAEIGQSYDTADQDETLLIQKEKSADDADSAIRQKIEQLRDKENCAKGSCATCSKQRRVLNVYSLKRGQHIAMPGQHFSIYLEGKKKKIKTYEHHAIIKTIKIKSRSSISMVLINMNKIEEEYGLFEQTIDFDLEKDEIYLVNYVHPRYNAEEIVKRAENAQQEFKNKSESESNISHSDKFKSYNLLTANCEHFATWCVVGEDKCFQLQSLRQTIVHGVSHLFGAGSNIAKGIIRLVYNSSDEIAGGFSKALPGFVLAGTATVYLIYCIIMSAIHLWDYHKGQMCWSCLKGKLLALWLTFGAFGLTSMITFLIFQFALPLLVPGVGIPLMILLVLLSVAFQIAVPRLLRAIRSPFSEKHVKVANLEEICIGDVIEHRYYGLKHIGIATVINPTNNGQRGDIKIVHYGLPSLFGKRKIVEENFKVDIEKSSIYKLDCKNLSTFPPDEVVSRARSRVGETKWDMFSNRSDHLTQWSKVQLYEDDMSYADTTGMSSQSPDASFFVEKREIHRIEDLRIGDVVKSNRIGKIDDTGILKSTQYVSRQHQRKIEMEVYTYSFLKKVSLKTYTVDLNKDSLYVKIYNPAQCVVMEDRAKHAKAMEGKKGPWWSTDGFIEYCLEKPKQGTHVKLGTFISSC